jgi:two-component system, OmpR family, phosphate regulon response regulator PhoB
LALPRLHIIDDDEENLSVLAEGLETRYRVETSSDPRLGLSRVLASKPALAIIDVDMPGMNGFEVCEAIRASEAHRDMAVIFLTSDAGSASMQRALRAGANDYVIKPFRLSELMMRIEFRLGQSRSELPLRCGNLSLDPATLIVTLDLKGSAGKLRLTPRGFRVLQALVRNEGRILTREQLLNQAWEDETGASDRSVDLHVFRLRKLLEAWDHEIETVYGRGYSLKKKARLPRGNRAR